jgi:hypothetical protein
VARDPKSLTRAQFSKFLSSPEEIRLFERLFEQAGDILPGDVVTLQRLSQESSIDANTGIAQSQQALDAIARIANSLELLSLSPVGQQQGDTYDEIG